MTVPEPRDLFLQVWCNAVQAAGDEDGAGPTALWTPEAIRHWKAVWAGCVEVHRAIAHVQGVADDLHLLAGAPEE